METRPWETDIPGIAFYGYFIAGIYIDASKVFRLDIDCFIVFRQLYPLPVNHHRAILNYNIPAGYDVIIAYDNAISHLFSLFCPPGIYVPGIPLTAARYPL
jgi:acetyltransferase-like isoleucine patch superfamily enzyme